MEQNGEQNGYAARIKVLESQMKDVRSDVKSINSRLTWLLGLGWVMVTGLIVLVIK